MGIEQVKCAKDIEDAFFKEQEQKLIQKLRKKSSESGDEKYREEHRNHCFRCGTPSLVEVERGKVKIDICVNENCGAIHLDPGELKSIIKDQKALSAAIKVFLSVFKN